MTAKYDEDDDEDDDDDDDDDEDDEDDDDDDDDDEDNDDDDGHFLPKCPCAISHHRFLLHTMQTPNPPINRGSKVCLSTIKHISNRG